VRVLLLLLVSLAAASASAQSLPPEAQVYLDDWIVTDEETGEPKAVMRIYERGGKVHGRVVRSLAEDAAPDGSIPCVDCEGEFAGVDLRDVPLLRNMEWQGDEFAGGRIYDPRSGQGYRCAMELEGPDQLRVRGFVGFRALGRTQVWERASAP